jgi:ligand-binding sensor domain-containing protein
MKSLSQFKTWFIVGSIAVVIVASTIFLSFSGDKKECNCAPEGWKTIRPPGFTLALAQLGDNIWTGGPQGLAVVDRLTGEIVPLPGPELKRLSYVYDLLADGDTIWIGHLSGLTSYRSGIVTHHSLGIPQGNVKSLMKDAAGRIWAGTEYGAAAWNGNEWQNYTSAEGLIFPEVDVIYQDRQGIYWFGSATLNRGGLASFDGKTWSTFTIKDGLVHNSINAILQDKEGRIWIGTGFGGTGGANVLSGGKFESLIKKDGLAGEKVRSLFEDKSGNLWFGSEYDGLAVKTPKGFVVLSPKNGLAGWEVLRIKEDSSGKIWIATENGITRLDSAEAIYAAAGQ